MFSNNKLKCVAFLKVFLLYTALVKKYIYYFKKLSLLSYFKSFPTKINLRSQSKIIELKLKC